MGGTVVLMVMRIIFGAEGKIALTVRVCCGSGHIITLNC